MNVALWDRDFTPAMLKYRIVKAKKDPIITQKMRSTTSQLKVKVFSISSLQGNEVLMEEIQKMGKT